MTEPELSPADQAAFDKLFPKVRPCTCGHPRSGHVDGWGPCFELDSYGIRCTCPAIEFNDNDLSWLRQDEPS